MTLIGNAKVARTLGGLKHYNALVLAELHYEVWVRALDHWGETSLKQAIYRLSGPLPDSPVTRTGKTDDKGDLRQRYLPCGEYLLEILSAGGKAVVAARCMEDVRAEDGGRETQSRTWPDAVRVDGATAVLPKQGTASEKPDEPGAPVPEELVQGEPELWPEPGEEPGNNVGIDAEMFEDVSDDLFTETPAWPDQESENEKE